MMIRNATKKDIPEMMKLIHQAQSYFKRNQTDKRNLRADSFRPHGHHCGVQAPPVCSRKLRAKNDDCRRN